MPDLIAAVKMLAGSTVDIAAASVGESSLVKAVRQIEGDGKSLDPVLGGSEPEGIEATNEVLPKEASEEAEAVSEEELKPAEVVAEDEHTEDAAAQEVPTEEAVSPVASPEVASLSAPTEEDTGESEDEAPGLDAAPEETISSTESSPVEAAPAEEVAVVMAEATAVEEEVPAEKSVEEEAGGASAEKPVEAAEEKPAEAPEDVETTQLAAAASGTELEILPTAEPTAEVPETEAEHCHSCQPAAASGEEVAPPAGVEVQLEVHVVSEEAMEVTHEAQAAVSLVEEQRKNIYSLCQSNFFTQMWLVLGFFIHDQV